MHRINSKTPSECTDIAEVRSEIDSIDQHIIDLLSRRFEYVKEVVKYKDPNKGSIEAPDRRREVLERRRLWAEEKGLDPNVVEHIYDHLIQYFISEELKLINV